MGVVYDAVSITPKGARQRVAFKKLRLERSDARTDDERRATRRFFDEAKIASRLDHDGIVRVLEYGVLFGEPFMVLELVEGVNAASLRERAGTLPEDVALHITIAVAQALSYAHRASDDAGRPLGITHRDVKPSNILISRQGEVKLADFGIAFALGERMSKTTTGMMLGTPSYMAPEQLIGAGVDGRADVFSLGCTLHAFLSGSSPLASLAPGGVLSSEELELSPRLPADIAEIVQRAVRKRADERFSSAAEMAEAMSSVLAPRLRGDGRQRLVSLLSSLVPEERARDEATATAREIVVPDAAPHTYTTRAVPSTAKRAPPASGPSRWTIFFLALFGVLILAGVSIAIYTALVLRPRPPERKEPILTTPPTSIVVAQADAEASPDIDASTNDDAATPLDASAEVANRPVLDNGPIGDGCVCIPISANDTAALCHPARLRREPQCRCSGERGVRRSFTTCDEPEVRCETRKAFPPSTRTGDFCVAYPLMSGPRGNEMTSGAVETSTLRCDWCEDTRYFPRKHGAPCRGIHGITRVPYDGRIHCH